MGKKKLEIDKKITIGATVVNLFLLVLLVLATRQLAFPPQKSNIKIYNLGNNYYDLGIDQILAVYNSGNAPCFNLEIYDDVYLSSVFIIKDKNVDSFLFETPFASNYSYYTAICKAEDITSEFPRCDYVLGYIKPNEVKVVGLKFDRKKIIKKHNLEFKRIQSIMLPIYVRCEKNSDSIPVEANLGAIALNKN